MPRSRTSSSRMPSTCMLHRDVERRGRLVGDEQVGLGDQHHGDHDALAHAAGKLVRIGAEDALGVADLHGLEHFQRAPPRLRLARPSNAPAALRRAACRRASPGSARISGPASPWRCARRGRGASAARRRPSRSVPSSAMRLRLDDPRRPDQAQDGAAGHRLARARLADDAERSRPSVKQMPRTASTMPVRVRKRTRRSSTSRSGCEAASRPLNAVRSADRARRAARRRAG